jgi:hypothetical protein
VAGTDPNSWAPVAQDLSPHDLEKALAANGWTFYYRAGAIRTAALGFNPSSRMAAALKRLIALATQQRCNCLQIDEVAAHSFLGVPYVSISAHPRHVQKGLAFIGRYARPGRPDMVTSAGLYGARGGSIGAGSPYGAKE